MVAPVWSPANVYGSVIAVGVVEAQELQPALAGALAGIEEDRWDAELGVELVLDGADAQVGVQPLDVGDEQDGPGLALQAGELVGQPRLECVVGEELLARD
jgi:hypothetical protein